MEPWGDGVMGFSALSKSSLGLHSMISLVLVVLGLTAGLSSHGETADTWIGDLRDGSRAHPVHRIPLMDEDGQTIHPDDDPLLPFSTRQTCGNTCHDYARIANGWHFNAVADDVTPGRPGHPWIYVDADTWTSIPLSYRDWPGTYRPERIGLTPWQWVQRFGRHVPGGGAGEWNGAGPSDDIMRITVSGSLEVNCLACHDAEPAHDQADYAAQIARQNFRWAATATTGFASIRGSAQSMPDTYDYRMPEPPNDPRSIPPSVDYEAHRFDRKRNVFFEILRRVPAERCYFCHSTSVQDDEASPNYDSSEDVHLRAGLTCVDCHRNGIDHRIVRGYEGETNSPGDVSSAALSCKGCHMGLDSSDRPTAGRMGAPRPEHKGLPAVHFERLSCTACHSGPWPTTKPRRVKTSLAHGLGTRGVDKSPDAFPHILSPVFVKQDEGPIAPHRLIWPSFWGSLAENELVPLSLDRIGCVRRDNTDNDSSSRSMRWDSLTKEEIAGGLKKILAFGPEVDAPVYVCGGKVYRLDEAGELTSEEHERARPYAWPIAHDVRPAAQSLGVRGCEDCHAVDAPFFFGKIDIDSPLVNDENLSVTMTEFQGIDTIYAKRFARTFALRAYCRTLVMAAAALLGAVLLLFGFRAFAFVVDTLGGRTDKH